MRSIEQEKTWQIAIKENINKGNCLSSLNYALRISKLELRTWIQLLENTCIETRKKVHNAIPVSQIHSMKPFHSETTLDSG